MISTLSAVVYGQRIGLVATDRYLVAIRPTQSDPARQGALLNLRLQMK